MVGVLSAIAACFDLRKVIDALGFLGVVVIIKSIQIKRSGHNLVEDSAQTQEEPVIETATPCAE